MKGMQKISRGASFPGVLKYVFADTHAKFLGTSRCMLAADEIGLGREFAAAKALRPTVERPVWHQSLRLPESEVVSHAKQLEVAHDYMKLMGFDRNNHQYLVVAHGQGHVHIVASRVGLDARLWYGRQENLISTRVIQGLEKTHGLVITKGPEYESFLDPTTHVAQYRIKRSPILEDKIRKPKRKELQRHDRLQLAAGTHEALPRMRMVAMLQRARTAGITGGLPAFLKSAEDQGLRVWTNIAGLSTSEIAEKIRLQKLIDFVGLVFEAIFGDTAYRFSGSTLGAAFSGPKLLAQIGAHRQSDMKWLQAHAQKFVPDRIVTPPHHPQPPRTNRHGYKSSYTSLATNAARAPRNLESLHRAQTIDSLRLLPSGALVHEIGGGQEQTARILSGNEPTHLVAESRGTFDELRRAAEPGSESTGKKGFGPTETGSNKTSAEEGGETRTDRSSGESRNTGRVGLSKPTPDESHRAQAERAKLRMRKTLNEASEQRVSGRREALAQREWEFDKRLGVILAATQTLQTKAAGGDDLYLRAAELFLKAERAAGREPSVVKWRGWDLATGADLLSRSHLGSADSEALTRLSPAAIRSVAAVEQQIGSGQELEIVDPSYGSSIMAQLLPAPAPVVAEPDADAKESATADTKSRVGRHRPR